MLFRAVFILYLISGNFCYGQYNHVDNGDFEYLSAAPPCSSSVAGCGDQAGLLHYWSVCWPWRVPEKTGFTCNSVGSSDLQCIDGPKGPHFCSGNSKEYVVAKLKKGLTSGTMYYIEFYFLNEPKTNAGLRFYKDLPKQKQSKHYIEQDGDAHCDESQYVHTGIITNPALGEWRRAWKYWVADDFYNYIAVGSFNGTDNSYQIDGIRIYEIAGSECPEWDLIQNISYTDDVHLTYPSSYITGAGSTVNNNQGFGPVTIAAQSTVTLKSSNKVVMEGEFHVPEGGTLHAYIAPCNADCFPPVADAGPDYTICQGGLYNIGIPTEYNPDFTYSWSSQPTSGLDNLSCADCPNPQLSINANAPFGETLYTLTVKNNCGQAATDHVSVVYDLKWPQYPETVNASNIAYDDYINFDISCNSHTEFIYIEVYRNSDNVMVYSKTLHHGDDFTTNPFHWQIDSYLTNCDDYTLKIYSKNYCNPAFSNTQVIPWIRSRTIQLTTVPNIFTPPNPPNANMCYGITGAENYEISVFDPSGGALIYHATGSLVGTNGCIWDGSCNGTTSTCPDGIVIDGTYQVVVSFWNCVSRINKSHFITVFNDHNKPSGTGDSSSVNGRANSEPINDVIVFPNPNNGIFSVTIPIEPAKDYTIEIVNSNNSAVYNACHQSDQHKKIDLSKSEKGPYLLKIYNSAFLYTQKIMIQ